MHLNNKTSCIYKREKSLKYDLSLKYKSKEPQIPFKRALYIYILLQQCVCALHVRLQAQIKLDQKALTCT